MPATATTGAGPRPLLLLAPWTRPASMQTSDRCGRYFDKLEIPVVILATVVATTATLSSNSCKSTIVF